MGVEAGDADFDAAVIERSHEVPVLVDFWAPWCGPCRVLGPVLDELAEADERFELVKVDTEQAPRTASRYRIRSIPAVKLFVGGSVVGEFVGALPPAAIRQFLDQHLPSPADERYAEGCKRRSAGDHAGAVAAFEAALSLDDQHAGAHLARAEMALADGDEDRVRTHVEAIHPSAPEYERGQFIVKALVFRAECEAIGGLEAAQARVDADDGDLDAWYGLGCCHAAAQRWPEALQALLEGVMRKNKYRDAAAHRAMLVVFGLVGHKDELTDTYQRKLQIYT